MPLQREHLFGLLAMSHLSNCHATGHGKRHYCFSWQQFLERALGDRLTSVIHLFIIDTYNRGDPSVEEKDGKALAIFFLMEFGMFF